jgi:SAM-dependent methyltransferase
LDLGAGFGRNARFFAEHGFVVTAVDNSPEALSSLRNLGDRVLVIDSDIRELFPLLVPRTFDVILCRMALHFLRSASEVCAAIEDMQRVTKLGGLNVVSLFTTRNPVGVRPYLMPPGELRDHYSAWKILDAYEGLSGWFQSRGGSPPVRHYVERITAQRRDYN